MRRFCTRPASPDDARSAAAVYARAFADCQDAFPDAAEATTEAGFQLLLQTGNAFLVAEHEGAAVGAVRHQEDEGILWFDLLASIVPGAGRELARAVDRLAQDRGLRLVRSRVPDLGRLPD